MFEEFVDRSREPLLLRRRRRFIESGTLVEDRHIGEADAAQLRGTGYRLEHRLGGLQRAGFIVQVMKLGDRGVAGSHHLDIDLARDGLERVGIYFRRERVHAAAPGPEIVFRRGRALLGVAGQYSLECVAVSVGESRDQDAEFRVAAVRPRVRADRGDAAAVDLEPHIVGPALRK